jgi:acetyl esterase/lipase
VPPERIRYGDDPAQWADLYRPEVAPRGVVVVLHGGFWRARYDASLGVPLAEDLAARGWTAWNLEYRRVGHDPGGDGGWPTTCDDVAAGIDRLADVPDVDLSGPVVTLGHSAGGHLATWAASRGRWERWQPVRVPVTAVVSQGGVLDLVRGHEEGLGSGAVRDFLGEPPGPAHRAADPRRQVPLDVPVWCVHGRQDDVVPFTQSEAYVAAARAAGGRAELLAVDGDHFTVIDPASPAWERTVEVLVSL